MKMYTSILSVLFHFNGIINAEHFLIQHHKPQSHKNVPFHQHNTHENTLMKYTGNSNESHLLKSGGDDTEAMKF
jgi:hypothetical protein